MKSKSSLGSKTMSRLDVLNCSGLPCNGGKVEELQKIQFLKEIFLQEPKKQRIESYRFFEITTELALPWKFWTQWAWGPTTCFLSFCRWIHGLYPESLMNVVSLSLGSGTWNKIGHRIIVSTENCDKFPQNMFRHNILSMVLVQWAQIQFI
jgi:hypothetical protein